MADTAADTAQRESRFEREMSPAEALMWNVEKDPWLNPSGASVSLIEGQVDPEVFERWLRAAVAALPRLRERVIPGLGRVERPTWRADREFDFGYHYRHFDLPGEGTERELWDLVSLLFQEPYDRTRPLWQILLIGNIEGDRSAVIMKLHHSIADGYGMARMQERFMVRDADTPVPDEVDLDLIVAATCAEEEANRESGSESLVDRVAEPVKGSMSLSRRLLGRAALTAADPSVLLDAAGSAQGMAKMVASQVSSDEEVGDAGSPLWTGRSRHRHLEAVRIPLDEIRRVGKKLDASVNDLFMLGLINGAVKHHEDRGEPAEAFTTSFVVSTRTDKSEGGNSFTPVRVQVPAGSMPLEERLKAVQEKVHRQRSATTGGGMMGSLAGLANLLPTSVTTRVARSQASRIDFATTNVRASGRPLYIAGNLMTEIFAPGPVAGSAMIAAVISYNGTMHLMMTMDPAAITEPGSLRDDVDLAYQEILASA